MDVPIVYTDTDTMDTLTAYKLVIVFLTLDIS